MNMWSVCCNKTEYESTMSVMSEYFLVDVVIVVDFGVALSHPRCAKVTFVPLGETVRFDCTEAKEGQFVTVVLLGQGRSLSLCEVEVFGTPVTTYESNRDT